MSISAVSGSSAYSSSLYTQNSTKKRSSSAQDDPMTQAISSLQSTDPTLASKLGDMQKQVDAMKKTGASSSDIQKTIKSTMDGLSDTEKSELKSAMPAPPSGGAGGAKGAGGPKGHHGGPPPPDASTSGDDSSSSFSASSLLDSTASTQNDAIMSLLSQRAASYATVQ